LPVISNVGVKPIGSSPKFSGKESNTNYSQALHDVTVSNITTTKVLEIKQ